MGHLVEAFFQGGLQLRLGAPGQNLCHKSAAGFQHVKGKLCGGLAQGHDTHVVGLLVTRRRGRHIRHHHIGRATQPGLDLLVSTLVQKIQLVQLGPGDGLNRLEVNAQHAPLRFALPVSQRVGASDRHLTPPTRRAPQIDHARARHQKADLVVQFQDLEGRTPPIAFVPRPLDIGVVQLPLQP